MPGPPLSFIGLFAGSRLVPTLNIPSRTAEDLASVSEPGATVGSPRHNEGG
jgi:hypothetical protein